MQGLKLMHVSKRDKVLIALCDANMDPLNNITTQFNPIVTPGKWTMSQQKTRAFYLLLGPDIFNIGCGNNPSADGI